MRLMICLLLSIAVASCGVQESADTIFVNGTIITMSGEEDLHSAIALKSGKVFSVGTEFDVLEFKGGETEVIDLKGQTLLPGFIDAHSHFSMAMQVVDWANLSSPPVSDISSIDDIVNKLQSHYTDKEVEPGEWIIGWGYDPDLLNEGRHPTKFDLDQAYPDQPVFLSHVSGHLGVVNSAGLSKLGWTSETPDPQGGQLMRVPGTMEPNGLIAESAMHMVRKSLQEPDSIEVIDIAQKAFDLYTSNGITTANDGFSSLEYIQILEQLKDEMDFPIDLISLIGFTDFQEVLKDYTIDFNSYTNRLKYAGVKIVSDGSPQGKTALMKKPYLTEVPGCAHDCKGISVVNQQQLDGLLMTLYGQGIQVYTHCNGDGAIEMFLNAHDQAIKHHELNSPDLRSVIIHSQFMRPDLIEQYARYGLIPSYFTNHTFYWGDTHIMNMGEERAFFTSPLVASDEADIIYTNHNDYPITPLDQPFMLWSATNRISRSGHVIGPDQKTSVYNALKALTINAAYQYREEDIKGTLEVGKLADLVVLSDNPLEMDLEDLKDIKIMATYKEGHVVYAHED